MPDLTPSEQRDLDRLDAQRAKLVERIAVIDVGREKLLNRARVRRSRAKQS